MRALVGRRTVNRLNETVKVWAGADRKGPIEKVTHRFEVIEPLSLQGDRVSP